MDKFLEVIGALGAVLVLLAVIFLMINYSGIGSASTILLGILPWAIPALLGFILIAAFGGMLAELKAIRHASETQAELLKSTLNSRKG